MIVPMTKYNFILFHEDYEAFLDKLQELGLVDVSVSGWEPTDAERRLLSDIETLRAAIEAAGRIRKEKEELNAAPYSTAEEALQAYRTASSEIEKLRNDIAKTEKDIEELRPWGDFSAPEIEKLEQSGVKFRFFTTPTKGFNRDILKWQENDIVEKIGESNGSTYFVVVADPDATLDIGVNEIKPPTENYKDKETVLFRLEEKLEREHSVLDRVAASSDLLQSYGSSLKADLQLSRVQTTAPREAENTLVVLEGYAPTEVQEQLDTFLAGDDSAYVIKSDPAEGDDPPVLLKNNRFARMFEFIGNFYSLPRYGSVDFTPYFAPFYMLFFGFCLADAGYGTLYVIGALIAMAKLPKYRNLAGLVLMCGLSTVFFGLLTGNAFGIELAQTPLFSGISRYMIDSNTLFSVALGVGIVHILYAMALKVIFTAKLKGFKYSLSTLGWMIVIISGLCVFLLPHIGITGYTTQSPLFWAVTGAGLFLMLFLNSPGKNPFVNFGTGLWNTYNDITGLLGDVLSYIRLFALGLSGGILALVFNRLAVEMSPDIVVIKQIAMILILGVGQGLTLFMSSLSAFVHPLRLTFVEFYKNAGFEDGGRPFEPLSKETE